MWIELDQRYRIDDVAILNELILAGRVTADTPVSTDGETWLRAAEVLDFDRAAILDTAAQERLDLG